MKKRKRSRKNDYKIIISELKENPIRRIKLCFALMSIIPLLVLFYMLVGKNSFYTIFLGINGLIVSIAVLISVMGFFAAYTLIIKMIHRLLFYFLEHRIANEEKMQFILAFTHDLKTPLTVIKTGMQNILDGIGGTANKIQQDMARICLKATDRATNFINHMLEVSKLKISMIGFKRELVDFEEIIKNEVKEISALAKKSDQKIHCRVVSMDPKLWGDRDKLSRVVMNLLSNAVKYTNVSGRIDVILSSDNDTVHLAIINTGSGIPADSLDKIFNKYERLKSGPKIEGAGLGLSIVKDIVALHNGHIAVKSKPGKETEFTVIFPKDLREQQRQDQR